MLESTTVPTDAMADLGRLAHLSTPDNALLARLARLEDLRSHDVATPGHGSTSAPRTCGRDDGETESARLLRLTQGFSARLAAERHVDGLVGLLADSARDMLGAHAVRVLLVERNDLGDVTVRATDAASVELRGRHFGSGDGILAHVVESGTALRLDDPADFRWYSARCDDLGTEQPGFLCAPLLCRDLEGVVMVAGRAEPFTDADLALLSGLAVQGAIAIANAEARESADTFLCHVSELLVLLLGTFGTAHDEHARAVARYTDLLTRRLELPEDERRTLHFAALLHDVGLLVVGDEADNPGSPVDSDGAARSYRHPAVAAEMLQPLSRWRGLVSAIHAHHERWDGQGGPRALAAHAVPFGGRVLAIADAFDTLRRGSARLPALGTEAALAAIEAGAGKAYDPALTHAFVEEYRRRRDDLGE